MIPKIIHQIWEGKEGPLPDIYKALAETWKEHYPDWQYIFWDYEKIDSFLKSYYPQYIEKYYTFDYNVQRWDAIRYLILNTMGGMYVDLDYESIKPMDELFVGENACFAQEPEEHYYLYGRNMVFNNALMAFVPQHSFLHKIIDKVFSDEYQHWVSSTFNRDDEWSRKACIVQNSTGPMMLLRLYDELTEKEKNELYLIPAEYVTPLTNDQTKLLVADRFNDEMELRLDKAYAVHYFLTLWLKR